MNLWAETAARLKRWEGLALVVVALACIGFQLKLPSATPTEADYKAAAAIIEQEAQPGDVVLLAPWFIERARLFVPERVPVVAQHLDTRDEGVPVATGPLQQPPPAGGQVVGHLGRQQGQGLEVDHVQYGR